VDTSFIIYAATALFAYGLVSKRLAPTAISGPMVFVGLGLVASVIGLLEPIRVVDSPVGDILELTLALLLFTDAAKVQVRSWSADMDLPTRLLTIGMPLTIVLGAFGAMLVLPAVGIIAALIAATILAPTDAALGSAVVTNQRVPIRIALDNSKWATALRPGLSVVVDVDTRDADGTQHIAGSGLVPGVIASTEVSELN